MGFQAFNGQYVEPAYVLPRNVDLPARDSDTEAKWRDLIGLIVRGLLEGGEARKRASLRLWRIARNGVLTEAEEQEVVKALWRDDIAESNDLPRETDLMDWPFLLLPEPSVGFAERTFRKKWLECAASVETEGEETEALSMEDINSALWQIGMALQGLRKSGRGLALSEADVSGIVSLVGRWADTPLPTELRLVQRQELPLTEGILSLERGITGLQFVVAEIGEHCAVGEKLFRKAQEFQNHGIKTRSLAAGLVRSCPSHFSEIVQWMRTGIASDDKHTASDAIKGLSFWLQTSSERPNDIQAPTVDLVREIGVIVATRREPALAAALESGKAILTHGTEEQRSEVRDLLYEGLIYLGKGSFL